jgi:hypothetical protein
MAPLPTKKISALSPFTPPLTGSEEFECVQLGNSVKVTSRAFVLPSDSLLTISAMGGFLPGSRQMSAGTGIAFVDNGPGSTLEIHATGAVAGPANPTASVGLAAVNGAAVTYMRSDAAPALDQAITPTWTGLHTFGLGLNISLVSPFARLTETDAAANNRVWEWFVNSETFSGRAGNDALSSYTDWVVVNRTGIVIDSIDFYSTALEWNDSLVLTRSTAFANPTGTIGLAAVNGVATTAMRSDAAPALSQAIAPTWTAQHIFGLSGATNAAILVSSAQPQVDWNETDGAANNRRWRFEAQGEQLLGRVVNDANSAAVTWLAVDRTLNVVDSIALTATALTWNGNPVSTAAAANPTASVGLAAVNGAASTFMRSDAAPALSQAIVPTWTGRHIFSATSVSGTGSYTINLQSASPGLQLFETDGAANNRIWTVLANSEQLAMTIWDDSFTVSTNWLTVDRTGTTIDLVGFPSGSVRVGNNQSEAFVQAATLALAVDGAAIFGLRNCTANIETYLGADGVSGFLGTATAHNLGLYTNNTLRFSFGNAAPTTGAAAPTLSSNKPGAAAGVLTWISVLTSTGTQGWVPVFGN